jgi:hypothetical protein
MHNVKSFFYFFVRSFIIKLLYKINLTILKTVNEEKIITFIKKLKIYKKL